MTPQHHIIKETSESLSRLLLEEFRRNGYKKVQMVDRPPKPDAIEGKLPAVSCYLYQVSLDNEGVDGNVHAELVKVERDDGTVEEFRRRRRLWLRLDYLISAWAQSPDDEQVLLGLAIRTIMENPSIPREALTGESFEEDFRLNVLLSSRLDEGTLARFWGSIQQPVRPAVQAWTSVPIVPDAMERFTRVQRPAVLNYRNLNDPGRSKEQGPDRTPSVTRRSLGLGGGGE